MQIISGNQKFELTPLSMQTPDEGYQWIHLELRIENGEKLHLASGTWLTVDEYSELIDFFSSFDYSNSSKIEFIEPNLSFHTLESGGNHVLQVRLNLEAKPAWLPEGVMVFPMIESKFSEQVIAMRYELNTLLHKT